jgi:hypothetical protein
MYAHIQETGLRPHFRLEPLSRQYHKGRHHSGTRQGNHAGAIVRKRIGGKNDGHPPVAVGGEPDVQTLSVMGDYFRVMQIPLRAGRDFTPLDREGQPLVAIVNEEVVREFSPHENPIGARIHWGREMEPPQGMTVIGVVGDVKHSGLDQPVDPAAYTPFPQSNEIWRSWMALAIRMRDVSSGLVEEVKKQVWSLDSRIPVNDVHTMDELMAVSLAQQRQHVASRAVRRARAGSRGRGNLRDDGLSRRPAHARDRHPHRSWSSAPRRAAACAG